MLAGVGLATLLLFAWLVWAVYEMCKGGLH
jgi:hypothetical protein